MRRREFIALIPNLIVAPGLAFAQDPAKVARIGFLGPTPAASVAPRVEALRAGLRDVGYVARADEVIEQECKEVLMKRLFACSVLLLSMVLISMLPQDRAEAAGARECDLYARRAVQQYQLTQMARFARRCGVAPSPRWQASYQNHNGWCRKV